MKKLGLTDFKFDNLMITSYDDKFHWDLMPDRTEKDGKLEWCERCECTEQELDNYIDSIKNNEEYYKDIMRMRSLSRELQQLIVKTTLAKLEIRSIEEKYS